MARSTLFSRNHSTLLLIKKRRLTNAIGDLLLKNFAIFTRKHVLKQACNFIKKKLQQSSCKCWEISKKPVLKNTCVRLLLKRLQEVIDQGFLSGESLSKPSRLSNITKIPVAFQPEPSLNLTPTLYFELRFPIFIINGYERKKKKRLQSLDFLLEPQFKAHISQMRIYDIAMHIYWKYFRKNKCQSQKIV